MGPWIKGTYIIQVFLWWWLQWRIELNFFEHSLLRYETEFFLPGEVWLSCQNGNQSVWVRYRSTRIKLILEWAYSLYNLIHHRLTSQNLLSFMSENHGSICSVCMNIRVVMAHDFHQWVLAILLWCWNCSCSELYKGLLMDLKKRGQSQSELNSCIAVRIIRINAGHSTQKGQEVPQCFWQGAAEKSDI